MLKALIPYQDHLQKVDTKIEKWTEDSTDATKMASQHLLHAGGKRIRPLLVILSADIFTFPQEKQEKIISLAAAVELLHMATLTHDDIVDDSEKRRGQKSIKEKWGEGGAVLIGDYMFVRAFNKFVECGSEQLVKEASKMTYKMCDGEVEQLFCEYHPDMTETDYYDRIRRKTALFFQFCCRAGARATGAEPEALEALGDYGRYMGMAFQIRDDLLDITGDKEKMGKPPGADLKEGIITLPLLHLLNQKAQAAKKARSLVELGKEKELKAEKLNILRSLIVEHGGVDYAQEQVENFARSAILALEREEIKAEREDEKNALTVLHEMAEHIIARER